MQDEVKQADPLAGVEYVEDVEEEAPIGEEKSPEEISKEDEFDPEAELVQAVQNARRSAVAILSSLSKTLYDVVPYGPWAVIRKHMRGETKTETGITIQAQERSSVGEVVSSNLEGLKAGDLVLYSNFAEEVKDCEELTGEKDLYIVRREEIYARLIPKEDA